MKKLDLDDLKSVSGGFKKSWNLFSYYYKFNNSEADKLNAYLEGEGRRYRITAGEKYPTSHMAGLLHCKDKNNSVDKVLKNKFNITK